MPEERPQVALVQLGWLVGAYDVDHLRDAERAAASLAKAGGHDVDLYEVEPTAAPLPPLGSDVNPDQLGWTHLVHETH
ncbi:MAG TPA: hypothetical protein VHX44_01675 [Planctomycetota bacterium]|nr:hypothetical protein [Planctomycetota bacterium]